MAVEYISYIQTENLLKAWPLIGAIKESLQLEIDVLNEKNAMATEDEYIDTLILGNKVISDIPPAGTISDTTGNIATSYQQVMKRDYFNTLKKITEEKLYIELVDDKLGIAFRRLTPAQQCILKLFYWEKKTWAEVLEDLKKDKHFVSKRQAQNQRRDAIEKLKNISKVTVEMYCYVMDMVEVE